MYSYSLMPECTEHVNFYEDNTLANEYALLQALSFACCRSSPHPWKTRNSFSGVDSWRRHCTSSKYHYLMVRNQEENMQSYFAAVRPVTAFLSKTVNFSSWPTKNFLRRLPSSWRRRWNKCSETSGKLTKTSLPLNWPLLSASLKSS